MTQIDQLLSDLLRAAKVQRLSKRQIAAGTGMHPNTLRLFGRPGWAPSPSTIRRMERLLLEPSASMRPAAPADFRPPSPLAVRAPTPHGADKNIAV